MAHTNPVSLGKTIAPKLKVQEMRIRITDDERRLIDALTERLDINITDILRANLALLEPYITTAQPVSSHFDHLLKACICTPSYWMLGQLHVEFTSNMRDHSDELTAQVRGIDPMDKEYWRGSEELTDAKD